MPRITHHRIVAGDTSTDNYNGGFRTRRRKSLSPSCSAAGVMCLRSPVYVAIADPSTRAASDHSSASGDVHPPCDICGAEHIGLLSKRTNAGGNSHATFIRCNPQTGQAYNVCFNCWDRVKGHRCGCRKWIHAQLEAAHPGIIEHYRAKLQCQGVDSPAFREFETLFNAQLRQCLRDDGPGCGADMRPADREGCRPSTAAVLEKLQAMTFMAMCGMRRRLPSCVD